MPVDVDEALRRGGRGLIDLLQFCVVSGQPEPLFVFLAREYRLRPTAAGALALYDVFCCPGAPARLKADATLPPRDLRLLAAVQALRQACDGARAAAATEAEGPVPLPTPAGHLFDAVVADLTAAPDGPLASVGRQFDPGRTPLENLPGGKMTPGQRAFVENVWRRTARPLLVAAGFWRVATLGQP
jgi:hypothetical protein